ncbi:ABC transporter permease [Pseudonocardia spinosispora]|uniref:ABC transporter permease n=1 Tax=Pseudonocardia spinosispora TaxID=103441 RepID=UPI00041D9C2B|nr:ABC transporter permease [Pseudonocardia spinosispora]
MNIVEWFSDPANWTGDAGIPTRLMEHLGFSGLTLLIAILVAVPIGAFVGHTGKGGFLVVGIANWLRALPDLGLLVLLVLMVGIHLITVTVALLVLAIPPLLAGTYSGVSNVDRSVVDAARGVGMQERDILFKVELPNALPLILSGLRSAALQVVATVAIAAYAGYGGLGRFIIDGQATHHLVEMAGGAVLIAVLALVVEGVLAGVQRLVVSPGLRISGTRARPTADPKKTKELTGAAT